jgi:hypothetical protein
LRIHFRDLLIAGVRRLTHNAQRVSGEQSGLEECAVTLRIRLVLCWLMTFGVAAAAVGAVMATSSTSSHRSGIAASLAFMIIFTGWI